MKTVFTLTLCLFCTLLSHGQDRTPETKVATLSKGLVPVARILEKKAFEADGIARLYRRPNALVKRELSFSTRASRPKIA